MSPRLEVVTVTYAPDFELFALQHESIQRFTDADVVHTVVVDDRDRHLFAQFASERCHVTTVSSVLPTSFVKVPGRNMLVNVRRPWPPVRGWVLQQLVKLSVAAASDADVVLLMDSDVVLTRPVDAGTFLREGRPIFFENKGGVHAGMARHVIWHEVARGLLGLPAGAGPPLDDYVDSFNVWSPVVVRRLCQRMTEVACTSWQSAFASKLHVSEFILYGVYARELGSSEPTLTAVDRTGCRNYWDEVPLELDEALAFVEQARADDVALMISAKSGTDLSVRRRAVAAAQMQ